MMFATKQLIVDVNQSFFSLNQHPPYAKTYLLYVFFRQGQREILRIVHKVVYWVVFSGSDA